MKKLKCQFYFSFRSPYAWIVWKLLRNVFPNDIEIIPSWNPREDTNILLQNRGGEFLYVNMLKEKHLYIMHDIQRIAKELGFKLSFPVDKSNTDWETIHLCYLYAVDNGRGKEFLDVVFSARWELGMDIWNIDNVKLLLQQVGLNAKVIEDSKWYSYYQIIGVGKLFEGYKNGVFGVPFFILGNSKLWGIERIIPFIRKWNSICDWEDFIDEKNISLPSEALYDFYFDHGGGCG